MTFADKDVIRNMIEGEEFSPSDLICELKSNAFLKDLYEADSGVFEGYSLERHTIMALGQYETYFAGALLPQQVTRGFFRLFLALHDIGKPIAVQRGDKKLQHEFTLQILPKIFAELQIPNRHQQLALALVQGDNIGTYLRGKISVEQACADIRNQAQSSGWPLADFFALLTIYYMSDAGSYTADAGGIKSLDYLFAFDRPAGRLSFAPDVQSRFDELARAVLSQT